MAYVIGDILSTAGDVRIQGDSGIVRVNTKDTFVDWVVGSRILLTDLGQEGNQWVAVRNVYRGSVTLPPRPYASTFVDFVYTDREVLLSGRVSFAAAWACLLYTSPSPRDS